MELDIVSMLLGQSLGNSGSAAAPALVGVAGYIGTKELGTNSTLDFTVTGHSGKYVAVLCWTRGAVVAPAYANIAYHFSKDMSGYELHLTLVKAKITSDSFTISISNPSSNRCGAVCYVVSSDFQATELYKGDGSQGSVTWPAGFSLFAALSGTALLMAAKWGSNFSPVAYIWPTDAADSQYNTMRCLCGHINAAASGSGTIGNTTSGTDGVFVCVHLGGVE